MDIFLEVPGRKDAMEVEVLLVGVVKEMILGNLSGEMVNQLWVLILREYLREYLPFSSP